MVDLIGEASRNPDGPLNLADEDRATVNDLLFPEEIKDLPPTKAPRSQ